MSTTLNKRILLVIAEPLVREGYMVSYDGADTLFLHNSDGKAYAEIWFSRDWKVRIYGKGEDFTFELMQDLFDALGAEC